ncbi:MAG: hypothetical protein LBV67_12225, partial [Streptococcaceae bacterium]|nr:hypothetical protein [Streptococcaceae bacterium]
MIYKCGVCKANDVANDGDICELCAISQDPYGGNEKNRNILLNDSPNIAPLPHGNEIQSNAPIYPPGQGPMIPQGPPRQAPIFLNSFGPISSGIVKNVISEDFSEKTALNPYPESDYQTSPTRTVFNNRPPTTPPTITVPNTING